MNRVFWIFLLLVLMIGFESHALFHFEPGIGYNRGHQQTNKTQGLGLSLKLGADLKKMFIVIDVGYHDLQLGSTPTSNSQDMGLTFGGTVRNFRIWYTHLANATLTTGSADNPTVKSGTGMKLGLSGEMSADFYLNLEARFIDLKKSTTGGTESDITEFLDAAFLSVSWIL